MAKEGLGLDITELRLGLPGGDQGRPKIENKKRFFSEVDGEANSRLRDERNMSSKSQVAGWPPVCSYRKKSIESSKIYVKVSMDGAPFLRKIDLGLYKEYTHLVLALEKMFGCFGIIGKALKDADTCEYIPIYEDKDGDWMLAGDVPWEMFTESCKRLRLMKRSEAMGFRLQPKSTLTGILKAENICD